MSNQNDIWRNFDRGANSIVSRQEIESLLYTAREHYNLRQFAEALRFYKQAYKASETVGDYERMVESKQEEGHCLMFPARYQEALVSLLILATMRPIIPRYYFAGFIDQIIIAYKLPIELSMIQNLIDQTFCIAEHYGLQKSKSMIYTLESCLALYRYDYKLELNKAYEALAWHDENALEYYNIVVCYRDIMDSLLNLNQIEELKKWMPKLQDLDTVLIVEKELTLFRFNAEIALYEGKYDSAFNLAERHLACNRETGSDCFDSLCLIVRTGIYYDKLEILRPYLSELLRLRHSENGHHRYQIQRLLGDYYSALYIHERGKLPLSWQKMNKHLSFAEKHYKRALKIGTEIDNLLQCDGRQKEIEQRLLELK